MSKLQSSISYSLPAGLSWAEFKTRLSVLEAFNGSRFYGDEHGGPRPAGFAITSTTAAGNTVYHYEEMPSP